MVNNQEFVNKIITKLSNKLSTQELRIVFNVLNSIVQDYNITHKKHEIIVYTGFPEEAQEYLVSKKVEGMSNSSIKQYYFKLSKFFNCVQKPVKSITKADITSYLYNSEKFSKLSPSYLDSIRSTLSSFFGWCVYNDYISKNPCKTIKPIKYNKCSRKPLSDIEMERVRSACSSVRDKAILEVLYSTGCRVSELVNIKISDIDMLNRQIIVTGKGNKMRKVFLNARASNALENYLNSVDFQLTDYVFVSVRKPHTKLTTRRVEKIINNLGKSAHISGSVYPHKIRHTTATEALKNGMPIESVKCMLGHESIDTTLIYAKSDDSKIQQDHRHSVI